MSVQIERNGPVTTVILSRPEVRNAVNRQTAQELADAFRTFDAAPEALANEFQHGLGVLQAEGASGAQKFSSGAGRHGSFMLQEETDAG